MENSGYLSRIEHDESISDMVLQSLKNYIVSKKMKTGDKLPSENELSSILGASRASIREAMKGLEVSGIITAVHGKGRFIRDFNYDQMLDTLSYNLRIHFTDFLEVVQVRAVLEEHFLPIAAMEYRDSDLRDLRGILDELIVAVDRDKEDYSKLVEIHTKFHRRLYMPIENKLLDSLISVFASFQEMLTSMNCYKTSDYAEFVEKHERLLSCLESREAGKIRESLKGHFSDFEPLEALGR